MAALSGKVPSEVGLLLLAGLVMVLTLWISRKARTVQQTEVSLAHQTEREERFESISLSRTVVGVARGFFETMGRIVPASLQEKLSRRLEPVAGGEAEDKPSFDLLRASVNLMVASAIISYATSRKLPLSTTYVTFMTAMGTSFADRAWGLGLAGLDHLEQALAAQEMGPLPEHALRALHARYEKGTQLSIGSSR